MTQIVDNGPNAVTIDPNAPDARSIMLASASSIATQTVELEGKIGDTAKAWGHSLFVAVYTDKVSSLDGLIGDSKVAAGWPTLTLSDAGKKAKARLEVYFSNARLVAERFNAMTDDQRRDILAGTSSIHYVAGQMRKGDADAKKEASKEAKRVAAEAAIAEGGKVEETTATDAPAPLTLADMLAALLLAIDAATDDELSAVYEDVAAVTAAYDSRINAAAEPEALVA